MSSLPRNRPHRHPAEVWSTRHSTGVPGGSTGSTRAPTAARTWALRSSEPLKLIGTLPTSRPPVRAEVVWVNACSVP